MNANSLEKSFFVEVLGISYPTLKKRMQDNQWKTSELTTLKYLKIITEDVAAAIV
jgi:hypothetical protein